MKDFLHIIAIPMTGLGLYGGYRGDKWYKNRIDIFNRYTLRSLLNQSNRDFVLWIAVRPEEKDNPLTKSWIEYLEKIKGLKFIFTHGGCYLWDDKYKNDNLLDRLEIMLPQLRANLSLGDVKHIYLTSHSSDDMLHRLDVEETQSQPYKHRRILVHGRGYVFNSKTNKLADWNPTTINPPFYTIMFPVADFFDAKRHFNYMRDSVSHEDVIRLFDPIKMPDHRYCVLIHGNQISTTWYHPYRDGSYTHDEAVRIMRDFGIEIEPELKVKHSLAELKMLVRYWVFKLLIRGRLYQLLKTIKNKYEIAKRSNR
jgi:hypothetical protein